MPARKIVILILAAILIIAAGAMLCQKYQAEKLCEQIRMGEEIDADSSNNPSAPLFLEMCYSCAEAEIKIPLVEACYHRNIQAVQTLLENGADPHFFIDGYKSPLEAALWNGPAGPIDEKSFEIVKMLVDYGCDVNLHASDKSVIEKMAGLMAGGNDNPLLPEIIVYLLDNGATEGTDYLLHFAARNGNVELARLLIEQYDYDPDEILFKGQNSVVASVYYSKFIERPVTVEMVQMLVEHGADPNLKDDDGKTALDYAVDYGYMDIVELLSQ